MSARNSVIPDLIDALVAAWKAALPNTWVVLDGPLVWSPSGFRAHVGASDPFQIGQTPAAESDIEWRTNLGREETGWVNCCVLAWSGDNVQKTARDASFVAIDALQTILRNRTISVPNVQQWLALDISNVQLGQDQENDQAMALWSVQINFRARI